MEAPSTEYELKDHPDHPDHQDMNVNQEHMMKESLSQAEN